MLRLCSIGARGLWAEMMCIMHEAERYGSLLVNGRRIDKKQLAGLAGISEKDCISLLMELEGNGVFSRDEDGTIYSRRMRRDFEKAIKDKENGRGGGNPRLKGGVNPTDNGVDKAQKPEARIDVADDARGSLISPEAMNLTENLLAIAGHDPKFWPPGWMGAPARVQTWLSNGWRAEIIVAAVRGAAARKRGPPANSVQFFENAIAEEVARQAAPLPKVEVREAEKLTVTHGTNYDRSAHSLTASLRRELAEIEREKGTDRALPAGPVHLLSTGPIRRS